MAWALRGGAVGFAAWLRGPLRVRALVRVRWPRTGRPRRWRMPRQLPRSMSRLMFMDTSRRRSPSTANLAICERMAFTSTSVRSLTLVVMGMPAASARALPTPNMWVSPTHTCLFIGMLMPAIRAISTLPLLVPRILADHVDHASAADDLALLANLFDGRPDFHGALFKFPTRCG